MNVYLPNDSRMSIGGAWRFKDNLIKGAESVDGFNIVDDIKHADISLIAGATMVLPETFDMASKNTRVVLRVDGVPELWRNHRHTWGRFKDYFRRSDAVVYQSEYTRNTTGAWLERLVGDKQIYSIIMNGVDKTVFKPQGEKELFSGRPKYLNVNSRKDPNKRIEEVVEFFRQEKLKNKDACLILVGKYPTYLIENDFGLYDYKKGRDYVYLGMLESPETIAKVMRSCDYFLFPSFADPCPNILIEALHVMGHDSIKLVNLMGGTENIVEHYVRGYDFSIENMVKNYKSLFELL